MEEFEGKNRNARNWKNRNRKRRENSIVKEKPIKAVNTARRYNPSIVELDDEVIDLRFIRSRNDLPV